MFCDDHSIDRYWWFDSNSSAIIPLIDDDDDLPTPVFRWCVGEYQWWVQASIPQTSVQVVGIITFLGIHWPQCPFYRNPSDDPVLIYLPAITWYAILFIPLVIWGRWYSCWCDYHYLVVTMCDPQLPTFPLFILPYPVSFYPWLGPESGVVVLLTWYWPVFQWRVINPHSYSSSDINGSVVVSSSIVIIQY